MFLYSLNIIILKIQNNKSIKILLKKRLEQKRIESDLCYIVRIRNFMTEKDIIEIRVSFSLLVLPDAQFHFRKFGKERDF